MNTINMTGTLSNGAMRVFTTFVFVAAQMLIWSGGCVPSQVSQDVTDDGGITNGDETNNGTDNTGGNGDSESGDQTLSGESASVEGYWMSTRLENGQERQGLATGGQLGETISIEISEDDGGSWSFSGREVDGRLEGTCTRPLNLDDINFDDIFGGLGGSGDDPASCTGVFSQQGAVLTLSAEDGNEPLAWTLNRATTPSPALIGIWQSANASGSELVSAFDGRVLGLLDPSDRRRQFDAPWVEESRGFLGTDPDGHRWIGLPMGDSALFVWVDDFESFVERHTFERQNEPTAFSEPLTGRWMSSYNTGELTNALRGQASVIFDGTNLYTYERDDDHRVLFSGDYDKGGYWSIFATYDGARFESTSDSTTTWSGTVDTAARVIHGFWNDDESRTFGFVRAFTAPTESDLTGSWSSLYSDYETPSEPAQTLGQSQVTFDGAALTIQDTSGDSEFVIEADWKEDHFEGEWWPANDPTDRGRWMGEVVQGGALIHGKWELGEWSFTPFTFDTRSSLGGVESGAIVFIGDPFEDIAAAYHNDAENIAVTVYRSEGVVNRYSMTGSQGTVEMTVDERFRPLTVVGPDLSASLEWSADSSSVDVTVDRNGTVTTETVSVDLSDQGLLATVSQMESQTGVNGDGLRTWISENPGRVLAVARGDVVPTGLGEPFAKRISEPDDRHAKNATAGQVIQRVVNDGAAIGGLMWAAVAAKAASVAATSTAVALGYAALATLAVAATTFIFLVLAFELITACFPCTLACFWNCGIPDEPRRACCIVGGGCITTTATECRNFGGIPHVSQMTCNPNPCQ